MIFKQPRQTSDNKHKTLSIRCPICHQLGIFKTVNKPIMVSKEDKEGNKETGDFYAGNFRCPNSDCQSHIFAIWKRWINKPIISYPRERIDFNSSKIPSDIVNSFEEAIICHANNEFTASAIMIRRTLEEICNDNDSTGNNLKQRIENLGQVVILPPSLLEGLDNLRLLGNDAAHVEARDYINIGNQEVEIAIDVTKEVLKAVYQLDGLVNRLNSLKTKD